MNNLLKLLTVLAILQLSTASHEIYIHQVAQTISDTTTTPSCWFTSYEEKRILLEDSWYEESFDLLKLNASWPVIYDGNYNTFVWNISNTTLIATNQDSKQILRRFCEIVPVNGVYTNPCPFIYNTWYADVETYSAAEEYSWAPDQDTDYQELVDNAENNQPSSKTVTHQFDITYTPSWINYKCTGQSEVQFVATTYVASNDVKGLYRLDGVDIKLLDLGRLGLSAGDKDTFQFTFHQLKQRTNQELTFYTWEDASFTIEKEITIAEAMTINLDTSDQDHNVFEMIQNYQYVEGHASVGIRMIQGTFYSLFEEYQRSEVVEDAGNVIDPFTTQIYTITFEGNICDSEKCKEEAEEEGEEGTIPEEEEGDGDGGSANIMKCFVSVFAALFAMFNL